MAAVTLPRTSTAPTAAFHRKCNHEWRKLRARLEQQLQQDIERIYTHSLYWDLELVFNSKTIRTHQSILQVRAARFFAEFCTSFIATPNNNGFQSISFQKCPVGFVEAFIRNLYTKNLILEEEENILQHLQKQLCTNGLQRHISNSIEKASSLDSIISPESVYLTPDCSPIDVCDPFYVAENGSDSVVKPTSENLYDVQQEIEVKVNSDASDIDASARNKTACKANSSSYSLVPVDEVYSRESPVHSRRSENRKHKFVSRKNKILEKELAEQDELLKCFQSIISKENKKHRKRNPKPSSLVPSSHNTKGQRPGCDSLHYKEASHKAKSNYNIRRESFKKTRPKLELTYSSGSTNINVTKARKRSSGLVKSDSFTFKNCRDSLYQDNVPTSCESTEIPRVGSKVSELTREDSKDTDNEFFESRSDFAEEKQNTNMDCVICCRSNKAHIRDNPSPAPSLSDEEFLDSPLSPDIMENHLDTKGVDSGTELTISYHGTGSDITTSPHGGEVSVSPLPGREHTVSETSGVDLTLSTEAVTEDFPDDDTGTKQKLTTLRPSNTPDEASDKEDGAFPIDDDTTTTSDDTRQEVYVDAVVSESVDERSTKPCDGEVISVSESSKQMGLDTNHERCDAGILEAMLISSDVTSGQVSTEEQFASYESHTVDKEEINLQNEEVAAVSVVEKDTGIECHEEDKTELGLGSLNIELAAEDKTVELSSDALVTQKDDKNEVIISQREPDVPVAHPGNFFIDAASLLDEDEIVTQFPASHDTNVKTQSTGGGCTEPAVREETDTTLSNPTDEPLLITPSYSAFINQDVTVPSTEDTQFKDNTEISEQHIGVCAVQSCSSENVQDQSVTLSDAKADKVSICRDSSEDSFSTVTLSGETPVAADISPPKENKFTNVKSNGDKHVSNGKEMIAEFFKEIKMTDFVTPAPLKNNEERDETDLHDCGEEGAGAFESSEQTCSELRREIYPLMVEEICNAEQDDTIEKPEKGEEEQLEKEHTPLSCDAYWAGERTEDAHEPTNFDEDTNRYTTVVPEGDTYTRFPPLLDDQADIRPLSRESELTNATTKETISETDSVKESTSSPEGSESHPPLIRRKTFELDPDDEQVAWLRQEYERRQGSLLFQSCIPQYSQHVTGSEGAYNGRSIEDSIGMNSAASQDTELSENMSDIMEVIVQDKPMEEKDKIQRFFNTQNIVQTTSVADKHPSVILPQSSLTSNVVLPVVEAEITQKNAHHFPLLEDDIHSPDSLNNDGPMEAFFPETVTVNETEDTIQSKYSMFTKKNWKPNMDTASPMDSFFNNNVTNEEKECDENGGIIEKQVNEYLEKECRNQQNIQVSRSCHEQQDDAYKENFKRLSSSYDNSSRPVVSGALTCSDIIDPKVYESPKRQKRTESTPIVSGGVSTEDFVAPVIKARDSPQTRRRTESTPILSGANTLVIESEKPKYKGSPKCPRKWDATPVLSAWVVDMSDCGGKSPETRRRRRQSDCVPIISGGLQAVEFVEQPVESPGKVSERELADAKGKNSSLGFFVDLSDDVSTEDSSGSKAKCKQETTAQKRNMFSMFIDISDVKNESSKASCSDESVKERASPSTAAVQIPPRKPAGLSSDPIPCRTINTQSQRLTDVATDSDEPTPKVCEQSKGVFMFIDASVPPPEKQPAKEPQEKPQKEKQGFFMFIEADPPVVRRQTHSGSRPTVKRHSWNLDAQITEEQRKHKRAQSLCVDKNMLFLSEDGIVKSSSEERSTMKLKTDSTQSLHEGEGSPSSSFKGSPLIKDKSSSTKQLSSYAKLREKITRRCSSFDSKVSCCKLMETEQFTRTTEKFEDAPSAYDASETKREFSASDNSKLVKVTPKEQSDVSNEKDVDDSKEIEDGPVNEHGDAKCSMQHLPGKAVDDHLEVSKDEAVNNNEISGTETAQKIEDKEKEINIEKEAKPSQDVTKAEDTCTPHVLDSMMTKSTDSQVSNKDTDKMKSSDDGSSRTEGRPLVRSAVLSHGRSGKLLPHAAQSPLPGARSQSPSSLASSTVLTRGRSKSPTSQSQTSTSTSFPSCHSPSQDTDDVETQFSETSDMSSMQSSVERSGLEGSTEETDVSSSYPGKGPCSRLGEDLLRMFLDEINTDVNVEVAGRRIKAHKCILSSRCQYFAAMLSGGWVESAGNIISLQGFSYNAVHFALCHIYSGTSNIPDSINIVELATLADMLGLEGLKEVIMYTLKVKYCHFFHKPCTMCAVGVLECLPLAAAYGLDEIYRKSLKWITKYFVRIWPTKSFASLPRELIEKCYHQHIVHMTVENVLDTVMSCDKLLATLPNVRWAEPLFGLTSQLLEASIKFIADNFSAVLTSEKFVCLGKELSWNISRLEDSIMAATESLPAEQACQSHMRLHRILAVVKSEDPPPEMQWSTSFVELLQRIQDRVQSSLIRQAPKAARCKSWNQMDAELREKIQEAACLVLDSEDGQKSRHSSLMRRSGRPKSQTSSTLYCTTPRNAGRGYSSHAVSATVDMRQVKLAMAQRSKFQRVQSGGSSTRSSANKADPIPVADGESVAKETPVQRRRTAPLASRSQKENQRPASMGQRFKKSSDAKSTEQAPRPKTWPMRMLEGKSSTPQKSSPAGTSSTSVSRTATPEKSAVPSRMKASSSDSSRTSSPAFHRVPRVARDIALYGSNTRPVTPTQIRKRETPKEKGSSLDLPQRTRSEQDASGKPKVSPGSSQIPVARTLSPEAKTAKLLASKELKPECESNDTQSPTARSDFVRARNSPSLGRTPGVGRFVSDRAPFSPLKDNRLKSSAVSSPTKPRIPSHTNSPMRKTAKPNEAASGGRAANKASVPDSSKKQAAKTDGKSAIVERAKLARSSSATVTKRATNSKNQSVVEKSRWPLSPKVTEPKNRNQVSPKGPRDGRNLKDSGRPSTPSEKGTRGGKQGAGKGRQHVANGMVSSGAVKTKNKQNNTSASSSSEKQEAKPPTVGSRSGTFLKDEPTILKKPEVENVQEQS